MYLLLVGNFLYEKAQNPNVGQELAHHLQDAGYGILTTSDKRNKILRMIDMLWTIWRYRNMYKAAQVDVFSGPAFTWAYISAGLLKKLQKPVVLTLHGGNLPKFARSHSDWVRGLLNKADAVTVPSHYLMDAMRPFRNDLTLIPNAIDINQGTYSLRSVLRPVLIWLRAFHQIYNPELAIRVLHNLHRDSPDLSLIMIGPDMGDGSFQETQTLVSRLGLSKKVYFPGRVLKEHVPDWLNKGDIFINTTNYDNTPLSVIEAMACGLCIVSTDVGGIPYLVEHEQEALLVPPNDPLAMSDAVQRILTEPGLAEKLSVNAHKKAEKFDWSYILPLWERVFTDALKQ